MKSQLIRNKYRILQTLGRNAFSETFLAKSRNGLIQHRCIIKRFRPILGNPQAAEIQRSFDREASILKRLSGHNRQIPRLYEYFMVGEDFYLVREWIDGLTLEQKVRQQGTLSQAEVEQILDSILSLLKYIHRYEIVYRQLKPSSIVLRRHKRLRQSQADFWPVPIYFDGVAKSTLSNEKSDLHSLVKTRQEYIPLEQKQGKTVYASDLYSLGLTTIYLLTGKTPKELPVDRHTQQILWHREVPNLKIHLARVIDRAICQDPQDRFDSAEAMLQALHSPLITISMPVDAPARQSLSEVKIFSILGLLGLGTLGIAYAMLNPNLATFARSEIDEVDDPTTQAKIEALAHRLDLSSDDRQRKPLTIPAFTVGDPQQRAIEHLGQPTKKSQGYWQNSRALLYRDFVPGVDLGYLTDVDTNTIRQSEMSFAPSVAKYTIQQSTQQLLKTNYSAEIANHIDRVYSRESDLQEFTIGNLKGIVQRNQQDYIYIAIWDSQFH